MTPAGARAPDARPARAGAARAGSPRAWSADAWPPLPLARRFVRLGAMYWLAMRVGLALADALAGGGMGSGPAEASPVAVVPLAAGAALLALVEGRRRRELHFLGNLGVRPRAVVVLWTVPVVLLELCLLALVALR